MMKLKKLPRKRVASKIVKRKRKKHLKSMKSSQRNLNITREENFLTKQKRNMERRHYSVVNQMRVRAAVRMMKMMKRLA